MPLRRRRERLHLNAEINVVSLIDVMLLLLVIFMLTAPMMQSGLDVALPEVDGTPLQTKSGMTVTITRAREIFLGDQKLTLEQFRGTFQQFAGQKAKEGLSLYVDKSVDFEYVLEIWAIMQRAGVTNIGVTTIPEGSGS